MRNRVLNVLKFFLFVFLAPVVIAVSVSFGKEIQELPAELAENFFWGVAGYVILYLFLIKLKALFQFAQRLVFDLFRFSPAIGRVTQLILPFYAVLLMIVLYFKASLFKEIWIENYFVFLVGFTFAHHIVLVAQELYEEDAVILKPHYLLMMGLTYIANLSLVAGLLDLIYPRFSFLSFFDRSILTTQLIYTLGLEKIFAW
ncbi:MAG: hypothetical protein WC552_06630 [Candidatus Omnitrophota bacterium]